MTEFVPMPAPGRKMLVTAQPTAATVVAPAVAVTVVPPAVRRYRAVVVRNIRQTVVVEFDAVEGTDMWAAANALNGVIPEDAWQSSTPADSWISDVMPVEIEAD